MARDRLGAGGIDDAARDAKLLAQHVLGCDSLGLSLSENQSLPSEARTQLDAAIARRLAGEPVARILGKKEFYGLEFALNATTLVPRPETELLVDAGIEALKAHEAPVFLDLGTGSGCIAISLLCHLPQARAVATDISAEALEQAAANAATHGVQDRITFRQGEWFEPLDANLRYDMILSNPPYIRAADIAGLAPEVRIFDPVLALDGGEDGLDPYRVLVKGAADRLTPQGTVAVEHGQGQAEAVAQLFGQAGFGRIDHLRDLAGIERVVIATR